MWIFCYYYFCYIVVVFFGGFLIKRVRLLCIYYYVFCGENKDLCKFERCFLKIFLIVCKKGNGI